MAVDARLKRALGDLRGRPVNYEAAEVRRPGWVLDEHRHVLSREAPGPPEPDGVWWAARALVHDYAFTPPRLVCAVYDDRSELLGRDILLIGRFAALRFLMGVRITALVDKFDAESRTWGWSYDTLAGHVQRGRVTYRVVKDLQSGTVALETSVHWQAEPLQGPLVRLGWRLVGRRAQLRFYRHIGPRLQRLVRAAPSRRWAARDDDGHVLVPSDAPTTQTSLLWIDPVPRRLPDRRRNRR